MVESVIGKRRQGLVYVKLLSNTRTASAYKANVFQRVLKYVNPFFVANFSDLDLQEYFACSGYKATVSFTVRGRGQTGNVGF